MKNPPHCHEPMQSLDVTKNRKIILPLTWQVALPPGEGRGEGESFERENRAVHGELRVGKSAIRNRQSKIENG